MNRHQRGPIIRRLSSERVDMIPTEIMRRLYTPDELQFIARELGPERLGRTERIVKRRRNGLDWVLPVGLLVGWAVLNVVCAMGG